MPELTLTNPDPKLTIPWFYNVTMAVGPGRANQKLDVKLVQFLLMKVFNHPTKLSKRPSGPGITVDGKYGPITGKYIFAFQMTCGNLTIDGLVDHANSNCGTISHTFYTILALNHIYDKCYGDLDAPWVNDPTMDNELAWTMFAISSQAKTGVAA